MSLSWLPPEGISGDVLGGSWRHLGRVLEGLGGILEGFWEHLGGILGDLGGFWDHLVGIWVILGLSWACLEDLGGSKADIVCSKASWN